MKRNDLINIIKKGNKAMEVHIAELKQQLQTLKLETARGEQKNLRLGKMLKRDIARLKTAKTISTSQKEQS